MNRTIRPLVAVAAGLALVGLSVPLSAATATAATVSPGVIVSFNSTYDPAYPSGQQVFADAGAAVLDPASSLTAGITVRVPQADSSKEITIELVPPSGKKLAVGHYTGMASTVDDDTKATGTMQIGGTDEGWYGDADVLALTANSAGKVTAFDVVFRNNQASATDSIFGEMRLGQPATTAVTLAATTLAWPTSPKKSTPIKATEWVHNTSASAVTIGSLTTSGAGSPDFNLTADTCSGKSLASGALCSVMVGFSPVAGGPRSATLVVPVGATKQLVSLSGDAPLGASSITLQGSDYVSGGVKHTFTEGPYQLLSAPFQDGWTWLPVAPYGNPIGASENTARVSLDAGGGGVLKPGKHKSANFYGQADPYTYQGLYGEEVSGFGRGCGSYQGSVDVFSFVAGATGAAAATTTPAMADVAISQACIDDPTHTMTARLQWQVRSDTTAPAAVSNLAVTSGVVSWTKSVSTDAAQTMVRLFPGSGAAVTAAASPTSGITVASGTGTSTKLPPLVKGQTYTVGTYVVDTTGNVSPLKAVTVIG